MADETPEARSMTSEERLAFMRSIRAEQYRSAFPFAPEPSPITMDEVDAVLEDAPAPPTQPVRWLRDKGGTPYNAAFWLNSPRMIEALTLFLLDRVAEGQESVSTAGLLGVLQDTFGDLSAVRPVQSGVYGMVGRLQKRL